jgi:c-di-GMP-binding flagellar brake protein YcgR
MDDLRNIPLSIHDLVEISVPEDETVSLYSSCVEKIAEGEVTLAWPSRDGTPAPLDRDDVLAVCFTRDETAYNVHAVITDLIPGDRPQITVHPVGTTRRFQRREYCRVRSLVPIRLKGLTREGGSERQSTHIMTHTFDISGAGLSIHQSFPLPPGEVFEARIFLGANKPAVRLQTRVVHCERISKELARPVYRVALKYVDISEPQRRAIVRHVFEVQRSSLAG